MWSRYAFGYRLRLLDHHQSPISNLQSLLFNHFTRSSNNKKYNIQTRWLRNWSHSRRGWLSYGRHVREQIANIAAPLTTSLSGAWLRSAAKGEAGELWHEFFDALIEDKNMYLPMSKILSVGETSGSDALMGFLGTIGYYNKVNKL